MEKRWWSDRQSVSLRDFWALNESVFVCTIAFSMSAPEKPSYLVRYRRPMIMFLINNKKAF